MYLLRGHFNLLTLLPKSAQMGGFAVSGFPGAAAACRGICIYNLYYIFMYTVMLVCLFGSSVMRKRLILQKQMHMYLHGLLSLLTTYQLGACRSSRSWTPTRSR